MKTANPLKRQQFHPRKVSNPHLFCGIMVIAIIYILLLYGCSSRLANTNVNDCRELIAKRYVKYRPSKQPKIPALVSVPNHATVRDVYAYRPSHKANLPNVLTIDDAPIEAAERAPEIDNRLVPAELVTSTRFSARQIVETKSDEALSRPSTAILAEEYNSTPVAFPPGILIGIPFFAGLALLRIFRYSLMKLSAWGAHHPVAAKGMLIGIHTSASLGALIAGHYFAQQGLAVSDTLTACAAVGGLAIAAHYPTRAKSLNNFTGAYVSQKIHDASLFATGIVLSMAVGNHLPALYSDSRPYDQQTAVNYAQSESREINSYAFTQVDPPEKKEGKIGAIIAVSILFTIGMIVVAALSCSIACSGAGVIAVLVAIVGEGALIAGLVAIYKKINRTMKVKPRKQKQMVA